jgi:hypothetical protein
MEKRIILGLAALPVSSLLALIAIFFSGTEIVPLTDIETWAETVTGPLYQSMQYVYIVAYVLLFFGYWALYKYLTGFEGMEIITFWGFIFSLWGIGLMLPMLGVFTYLSPYLAQLYQEGNTTLPDMINSIAKVDSMYLGMPAAVCYSAGTILFGIGIFRAGILPRIIPIVLMLHGLLLSFSTSNFPVLILAWLTLFASSFSLTYFVIVSSDKDEDDEDEIETHDREDDIDTI